MGLKNALKRLNKKAHNSILNPKIGIKDVGDTARTGLKGNFTDKRANFRAHHEKTIHPFQTTAQTIITAERLKSSNDPVEVQRGIDLRAIADTRSKKAGMKGIGVGLAIVTGGATAGVIAAVGGAPGNRQGAPLSNEMPTDPNSWHPGDAYPDPTTYTDTQQQMYSRRAVGAPARTGSGGIGVGGLLQSIVNFLHQILVTKK